MPGERCGLGRISLIVVHAAKFELPARLNHCFGARRIAFAGQLHQNFIIGPAGESDGRLGQSECIDAALDGFERLIHRLLAKVRNHRRLHGQQIAGLLRRLRARDSTPELVADQIVERVGRRRRNVAHQNVLIVDAANFTDDDVVIAHLLGKLIDGLVACETRWPLQFALAEPGGCRLSNRDPT